MASIVQIGTRWRAQVRKRGQSIAKTFKTKSAAQAWAREKEVEIENGRNAVEQATVKVGELVRLYRQARADSGREVKAKSNEDYILQRLEDEFESDFASRLIRVAMLCAFRRGELFSLRWDDIDAENHLALVRDRKHPRQKIGNNEWIPLIGDSFEVIMRQPRYIVPAEYAEKRKADLSLPPHRNEHIFRFDKGTASKYFKQACDAKGIENLHLHDLRHEATNALFEAGWQIPEVAAVTGHKDWRNLKRYTNLDPAQVAKKGRLKLVKAA